MSNEERGLFQIRAINKDTDEIVFSEEVVADGESDALFNSKLRESLKKEGLDKDDVHIVVREFGSIPKKERSKTIRLLGKAGNLILGKESNK